MSVSDPAGPAQGAIPLAAVQAVAIGNFFFSLGDTGGKLAAELGLFAPFASAVRYVTQAVVIAILFGIWRRPRRFRAQDLSMQLGRGALACLSGAAGFLALKTLGMAEFISIVFSAPIFIVLMGRIFLGERAERRRYVAIAGALLGVLIITRPGFGAFGVGHVYAIVATLSFCGFAILTRQLSRTETQESLLFIPGVVALVAFLPVTAAIGSVPTDPDAWVLILAIGIVAAIGQIFVTRAYTLAPASAVAPYAYVQMLFSAGLGWLLFDDVPNRWTVLGATTIVASGLYLMHLDRRARRAAALAFAER